MKTYTLLVLLILTPLAFAEHYGEPISLTEPLSLQQALTRFNSSSADNTETVLVAARVGAVCQQKGCWLSLEDDAGTVRVTFKDYGFFVPFGIKGKTVLVQGELERVAMSLEETKHYVADAGGNPDEVTEPQVEYRMVASGVEIKG